MSNDSASSERPRRWYQGVSAYEWLVLVIACAGWIFDVYEGQIFGVTSNKLLEDLVVAASPDEKASQIKFYREVFQGVFLAGGMIGGILFGVLGDRWGRRPTMIATILVYSIFSGATFFATSLTQVAVLRFLVALGVGGEWAVAAALVAEVFPTHARAQASSIFHASSTLGTWMAGIVGWLVIDNWRYAYLVGVLPAILILWVRAKVEEPEAWKKDEGNTAEAARRGSFRELLGIPKWRNRAILGLLLASVGLGSFWGVTVAGQELAKYVDIEKNHASAKDADQNAKLAYGIVQATGGGIGLIAFGPLCQWLGRRGAFALVQLSALIIVPMTCFLPQSYGQLLFFLPFYGACTLAMHAGYSVYFPELFPAHLRATGASFCFNGGRIMAAVMMPLSGWVKSLPGMTLPFALTCLSSIFLLGLLIVLFLPETKGKPLPE